ncbi:gamma-glutamyltransferase [Thermoleophilum album]|jgi:gamma-glutamyltranspeptidase/glutathione hydrolase|uniref:gamma-glutamyltransferase family protein n=1 Tax=Thermoleophilum album TaxID=29539 RepID=UPI00237CA9DB|nr:gamma-glutamyltransferase [Thermoleophilum album]WDT94045.1 gamma-glutamyltransferase [Thermoleophilum album]
MKGVVAAGHPLTAEAGARILREGGNAIDAAVAAGLMSWVAESPLTGPGAGGFMLVHTSGGESTLFDFFVAAPGKGLPADHRRVELIPLWVEFTAGQRQRFNVGPASCGVYGTALGLVEALKRFGTRPLAELAAPAARAARAGVEISPIQGYLLRILEPILRSTAECERWYAPEGRILRAGERIRLPELGDLIERLGGEGPDFMYRGDVGEAVSAWVLDHGGAITRSDLAEYQVVAREPARAAYAGRVVLTNPPPSAGGILIAYALDLLERLGRPRRLVDLVAVMERTNRERTREFTIGLHSEGYLERFLAREALERAAAELRSAGCGPSSGARGELGSTTKLGSSPQLGSTTHIAVIDGEGNAVSMTCSNGSCSGVVVPGTGVHLNNMLGEEDLSPEGVASHRPGRRVPSMMAPTVVLRAGECELALGSAGSNRIRSAILQTILAVIDEGLDAARAVERPRLHCEQGRVDAEPGLPEDELREIEARGFNVVRWPERNLYFGGVQAVGRDPVTGALVGGGDPRRGGAVALA